MLVIILNTILFGLVLAGIRAIVLHNDRVRRLREEEVYPKVLKPGNVPTLLVGECDTCGAITGYRPEQVGTYTFAGCGERGCYGSTQPIPHDSPKGKVIYEKLVEGIEKYVKNLDD